jgi:hypothetical protein
MMKNKGKGGGLMLVGVISLIAILGFIVYSIYGPNSQTAMGGVQTNTGTVSVGCNVNPTMAVAAANGLNPGTAVTVTGAYIVNGQYMGASPTFQAGDNVNFLINASGYLNNIGTPFTVACGANNRAEKIYQYGNGTITVYSNAGTAVLTNAAVGGANNETKSTSVLNWKVHFVGNDKKSTGKQLLIVELSTPANVTSVTLSQLSGGIIPSVTVPNGYTKQLTNGYVVAFEVPAMVGAGVIDYNLQANAANGNTIQGAAYTTWYATHPFIQDDGTIATTGAFSNLNTAKYIDKQTYNFYIL